MEVLQEVKTLQLKKMERSSYKIIITKELEKKIRFVCSKVSKVEWSGVLFYTHEGEFDDGSLVITAQDMIVLDIGNGASTEFKCSNPDVITYMVDNDLLDCDNALIHSHNDMATFFSSQDQAMLVQEGTDRNVFVSLIVNNAGTYTAGITRKIASKIVEEKCYKTFGNKEICKPVESYDTQYIEWYNLEIIKEEDTPEFPELQDRLLQIAEHKKALEEERRKAYNPYPYIVSKENKDTSKNQLSLFAGSDDDIDSPIVENPIDENHPIEPNEDGIEFDESIIENCICKILTGDINADSSVTKLTIAKTNSNLLYQRTFPKFDDFKYFAEGFLDIIVQTWAESAVIITDKNVDMDNFDVYSIFASYLNAALEYYTDSENSYALYFTELLNNYL